MHCRMLHFFSFTSSFFVSGQHFLFDAPFVIYMLFFFLFFGLFNWLENQFYLFASKKKKGRQQALKANINCMRFSAGSLLLQRRRRCSTSLCCFLPFLLSNSNRARERAESVRNRERERANVKERMCFFFLIIMRLFLGWQNKSIKV